MVPMMLLKTVIHILYMSESNIFEKSTIEIEEWISSMSDRYIMTFVQETCLTIIEFNIGITLRISASYIPVVFYWYFRRMITGNDVSLLKYVIHLFFSVVESQCPVLLEKEVVS
jgi:hypothetical protein